MKKIFLISVLFCINIVSVFAQSNNSMQVEGLKIIQQSNYMLKEAKLGKISVMDNATIEKYAAELNLNNPQVPLNTLASQTYQTITDAQFNFSSFVNNSNLTLSAKNEILSLINTKKGTLSTGDFQNVISNKVSQINANTAITENEKKILLTLSSVKYNLASTSNTDNSGFLFNAFTVVGVTVEEGIFVGIIIGGIIGTAWGPVGTAVGVLVGAVVGLIVGSIS